MWKDLDSCPLGSNDPGGRGRISGTGDKPWVVVGTYQTEDEDAEDVEQEDTDPDATNGNGDGLGRVTSFCSGHPEDLSAQEGVSCADQYGPETSEATCRARNAVELNERTGVMLCVVPRSFSYQVCGNYAKRTQ